MSEPNPRGRARLKVVARTEPDLEEERDLVERAKRDPDAFGALFDRYHDPIFSFLLHRTADAWLAREIAADTFFRALSSLGSFRWRGVPFSAWLFRIASNELSSRRRRLRRAPDLPLGDVADNLSAPGHEADRELADAQARLESHSLFQELHRHILGLPPRYQDVIVLRYFEQKSLREIATITGRRLGTIKAQLHRAHRRLGKALRGAPVHLVKRS